MLNWLWSQMLLGTRSSFSTWQPFTFSSCLNLNLPFLQGTVNLRILPPQRIVTVIREGNDSSDSAHLLASTLPFTQVPYSWSLLPCGSSSFLTSLLGLSFVCSWLSLSFITKLSEQSEKRGIESEWPNEEDSPRCFLLQPFLPKFHH